MQKRRGTFVQTNRTERSRGRRGSYFSRLQAWLGSGLAAVLLGGMLAGTFAFPAQATNGGTDGGGSGVCTVDSGVTTYVGGNLTTGSSASEIEGVTVVKGDADITHFSNIGYLGGGSGSGSAIGKPGDRVLSVGGDLATSRSGQTLINATAVNGNGGAIVGGAINNPGKVDANPKQQDVGFSAAVGSGSPYNDFTKANNNITQASGTYSAMTTNTAAPDASGYGVTLDSINNSATQVYSATETTFNKNEAIHFTDVPAGATMVVNISGTSPVLAMQGGVWVNGTQFSLHGSNAGYIASHIVWNFYEATSVSLQGQDQLPGMILVPNASSTTTVSTHLNGRVFVNGNLNFGTAGGSGLETHSFSAPGFPCQPPTDDPDSATIVVHKGGDRVDAGTVAGLAGATFAAYAGTKSSNGSLPSPLPAPADTCVTDANGTCALNVPPRSGGHSTTNGYWIVETDAPDHFSEVGSVGTGVYTSGKFETAYRYFVEAPKNSTSNVPADAVIYEKDGSNKRYNDDSSGLWADIRDNGDFPKVCGVSIAVVFDVSNSVSSSELKEFKKAAKAFVDDGLGQTPSTVTMFKFASTAKKISDAISLATSNGVDDAEDVIDDVDSSGVGQYTNWDQALQRVSDNGSYDLVLFLTDGDPTTYGDGSKYGSDVYVKNLDEAIFSANQLKAKTGPAGQPTMILPVGIGLSTNSHLNLKAISGPEQGEDYYLADDFSALEATLKNIATQNCGGSVTVTKKIADESGAIVDDAASGWDFTGSGSGVTTETKTTGTTGTVNFKVDFGTKPTGTKNVTIVETQQDGFTLKQAGSKNAVCTDENDNKVTIENSGALGFMVPVGAKQKINCVVVNRMHAPHWTIEKAADKTVVQPGDSITYTLTAHNDSKSTVTDATATDMLVAGAAYADGAPSFATGSGLSYDSSSKKLTWSIGSLGADQTVTTSYTVKVKADAWGVVLTNEVTPGTHGDCITGKCTTTTTTPDRWALKKTSDPVSGSQVKPGDSITYTLTAENDSAKAIKGATAVDDLSDVLSNATVTHLDARLAYDPADDTKLVWSLPDMAKNATVTVSYTVKVNADAWGVSFANVVTPNGEGTCVSTGDCTTTHNTPGYWVIKKTADPVSGSTVQPDGTITYTLEATSKSKSTITGASAVDELKDVLAHATLTSHDADLSLSGTELTWALPAMTPGQTVTTKYTVTVDDDAWGVTLDNLVTPGTDGHCVSDADCTTTHATPGHWTIVKTSDPVSGSTVQPGSVVKYTLKVHNDSSSTITGQSAVDDLSKVLGRATLTKYDSTQLSLSGDSLTWSIPDVKAGEYAEISYEVTIDEDAWGATLKNVVTPKGDGICVLSSDCTTTHQTPGNWTIEKSSDPASGAEVQPGSSVTYTLTVHNKAVSTLTGATAVDDLSSVLAHAQVTDLGAGLAYDVNDPTKLVWSIPAVKAGKTATVTYTVKVDADAWAVTLRNHVTPTGDGVCVDKPGTPCETTHETPGHWTLAKTSSGLNGSPIKPGDTVTYTLTAHNDSARDLSGVTATDDLSGLLDHVSVNALPVGLQQSGPEEITWNIGAFDAGATVSISYTVLVDFDAWGVTLTNLVTPGTDGHCVTADDCTTTDETPDRWVLEKSSDPESGSTVQPGSKVHYTLTARNLSAKAISGATAIDELKDVLSYGAVTEHGANLATAGTTLVWSIPTMQPHATVTVGYTVTVDDDAWGVTLTNVVTPGTDGVCETDASCTTTHDTPPHFTLVKTSDPVSGSVVMPGTPVTYTLTAHNDSAATVSNGTVSDDLADILDDASLVTPLDPSLTLNGTTLEWTMPALPAGQDVQVSYTVLVNADAWNASLVNVVTPGDNGECVEEADCTTDNHTPDVNLGIVKSHDEIDGDAVDSGKDDVIPYRLVVENRGTDAATGVTVTDELPAGLTVIPGSESLPSADWAFTVTGGNAITVTKSGSFGVGEKVTITFDALVGTLDRSGTDQPYPSIDNEACVSSTEQDSDLEDNCSTDTTPTKSIAVTASAICVLNAPYVQYSLTPFNVTQAPKIAIVWWTKDAYDQRDPSIDAADEAGILADGASAVDYVTLPAGWKNGEPITGTQLWPGAAVDADGNGVAWPGWRQLPTGQWVLDPGSQFYQLRSGAVIEVRINPTTAVATSYPTEDCAPKPEFAGLVNTGSDVSAPALWGGGMLGLGLIALLGVAWARSRRKAGGDAA